MSEIYDYIIVGGGPSGLVLSNYLSKKNDKILLVEMSSELGGCHRVLHNNSELHMEHSVRIYPSSFNNFYNFLDKELNIKKNASFVSSTFQLYDIEAIKFMMRMNILDIIKLLVTYIISHIFKVKYPINYTMENFIKDYNIKPNSVKVLNNICNLIDGGDVDKTLLGTFLDAIDKLAIYKILQPNMPMDKLIFDKLKSKLLDKNVNIMLNSVVDKIEKEDNNYKIFINGNDYICQKLILAIPPYSLNNITNAVELLGYNKNEYNNWCNYSLYKNYISFTFEFNQKIYSTYNTWGGISEHPWGEIFIDMSHYFKLKNNSLIILTISNLDVIDPITNKTANELTKIELINRAKDILMERLKTHIKPINYDLYPYVKKINGKWIQQDKPFILSKMGILLPPKITKNIYTVGHHNGNSNHKYNTIESAVVNSIIYLNKYENFNINILNYTPFSDILLLFIFTILLFVIYKKK